MAPGRVRIAGALALAVALVAVAASLVAVASAGVVKHDTKLTISTFLPLYHGKVKAGPAKCERERRVILFERRPGRDRKVGKDRSNRKGRWKVRAPVSQLEPGDRFRARVRRKLDIVSANGYVCRAASSRTVTFIGD